MVIFKCYFSKEHIALSYKKWCEHRIRKNEQIKSIVKDVHSHTILLTLQRFMVH